MSIQDTKERIFVNGQIYSRPIGGGPVHGPDTRRFTPDPNPYDVAPDPRGYGQGTVDTLLYRPGVDKFEIENPVLRPGDTYEVLPLDIVPGIRVDPSKLDMTPYIDENVPKPPAVQEDVIRYQFLMGPNSPLARSFLDTFMNNRGITEQNQEVMGSKEQVFPRYANPEDGTLNNEEMARVDPIDKLLLKSLRKGEIGDPNNPRIRKAIIDLERKIYNAGS